MEQKQNKQLHTSEYPIEYSDHEQQLIYEVISGIFLKYSARYTRALGLHFPYFHGVLLNVVFRIWFGQFRWRVNEHEAITFWS